MNKSKNPNREPSKQTKYVSARLAYPMALIVWEMLPWAISLLAPRYGWVAERPGMWNWFGLIPVLAGTAGLLWGVAVHSAQSPHGIEWELDKSYLLMRGMYAYSRHPMYLSELILILGWVIFYGSVAVLITAVLAFLCFNYYMMPREERVLEEHFGDAYREYKRKVRRWLGRQNKKVIEVDGTPRTRTD